MIIGKLFEFEAGHSLPNNPAYGECCNLHGHSYKLIIEIEGDVTELGWVENFKELKRIVKREILDDFDHKNLNSIFKVPTAENMVLHIQKKLQEAIIAKPYKLHSVQLFETSGSYAKIICK